MKHKTVVLSLLMVLLLILNASLTGAILIGSAANNLSRFDLSGDEFRSQQLSERTLAELSSGVRTTNFTAGELLTIWKAQSFLGQQITLHGNGAEDLLWWKQKLLHCNPSGFEQVGDAYRAIWDDVVYFPVVGSGVSYENSWMFERTYGGVRGHEGTDLMPPENLSGYYRIISMTDGVVEHIGWLPLGGYRIGIRSPLGGYYYYAHLSSYAQDFQIGDHVEAGELLGLMGDTGYGEEGTRGRFPVHLHLGIYLTNAAGEEYSVNPYWVLRYLQTTDT